MYTYIFIFLICKYLFKLLKYFKQSKGNPRNKTSLPQYLNFKKSKNIVHFENVNGKKLKK